MGNDPPAALRRLVCEKAKVRLLSGLLAKSLWAETPDFENNMLSIKPQKLIERTTKVLCLHIPLRQKCHFDRGVGCKVKHASPELVELDRKWARWKSYKPCRLQILRLSHRILRSHRNRKKPIQKFQCCLEE